MELDLVFSCQFDLCLAGRLGSRRRSDSTGLSVCFSLRSLLLFSFKLFYRRADRSNASKEEKATKEKESTLPRVDLATVYFTHILVVRQVILVAAILRSSSGGQCQDKEEAADHSFGDHSIRIDFLW